ncbi:MAG: hydroxylamine reductase [Candidatus Brocadiia bacterium]
MFCYQCEQTAKGTGCTIAGVCGKDSTTAAMQDLLVYVTKGIGLYASAARKLGARSSQVDRFVLESLFTTVTNVNFDAETISAMVNRAVDVRDNAKAMYENACRVAGQIPAVLSGPATWLPASDSATMLIQAAELAIDKRLAGLGPDISSLQELLTYGLKGTAAYADHAMILGQEAEEVYEYFHRALAYLASNGADADKLTALVLECGKVNLKVMELLDTANTSAYGHPVPTKVPITHRSGHCILVSGHDLKDLDGLLRQTAGKGITIYTHGEMLPAHGYPQLKKYSHLYGNYGGAWQNQRTEFAQFPGAILMTTNCIQRPQGDYINRIFTSGLVQFPGVKHISDHNFKPVIDAALAAPGFSTDEPEKTILVGFGHNAVMSVAGPVIDAVKAGQIKHFFLIGGCDGAKPGRDYYTDFATSVPKDCVILTLACGKYRFNKLDFGDIGGIPRLLDIGQCNDAYSAIKIAVALAEAFGTDVNSLPLSLIISWYEQKAVCILLTLLYLGIKNIHLGPSLPAFVSPNVLSFLVEKFNIKPISTPEADLKAILG